MGKVHKKFGVIEPMDRLKMKDWMAEPGVVRVAVLEGPDKEVLMQRVGLFNDTLFGVKKRFQKAPKNKK